MVLTYRRKHNKGVLGRPWTERRILKAISSTLKFQYFQNHENLLAQRLVRLDPAKVREKSFVWSVPSSPRHP